MERSLFVLVALSFCAPQEEQVSQLESDDPRIARRAFESLIRRGEEGPITEIAKKSERGARVRAEIQAHRRFGDGYPGIQPVNYEAKERPADQILEEVGKLLGMPVMRERLDIPDLIPPPLKEKTSLSLKDAYPLEALGELGEAAGLSLWVDEGKLVYSPGAFSRSDFRVYHRHFLVYVDSYDEERRRSATGETTGSAFLRLKFEHDWLTRVVGMKDIRLLEITDDRGNSLLPENPRESVSYGRFSNVSAQVGIKLPDPAARTLSRVRGVLPVLLPERPVMLEISLEARKSELSLPNLLLKLEKVSDSREEIRVVGKVADLTRDHVWPEAREFQLKGKDGRLLPSKGARAGQRDSAVWELSFVLPPSFEASSLVVRTFQGTGELTVPFDFKDLPLR